MNFYNKILYFLLLFISFQLFAKQKLVIKGSDTLGIKMITKLAEAFENKHSGTNFEIAAEGSSTGIAAIIDGTADIGMSSRELRGKEKFSAGVNGVRIEKTIVARDAVAVIVNQANPINKMTLIDIERIFTDDVKDWSSIGGKSGKISTYTRNTASGTYSFFQKFAMSNRDYGSASQKMAGNEQIATEVAKNENGIGYIGLAYASTKGIKIVSIDGILPSAQVGKAKHPYRLTRALNCFTNGKPRGTTKLFLDFILSKEGQEIVSGSGFLSIEGYSGN